MTLLVWGASFFSFGQIVFEQGIVQGGVSGAGFSTGMGFGSGTTEIYIEPNSEIKKAYMFFYSLRNPSSVVYEINNQSVYTDSCVLFSEVNIYQPAWNQASPNRLFYKDITSIIEPNSQFINVTIPYQVSSNLNEGFWAMYILVVYENINLGLTDYTIILNNQDLIGNEVYQITDLNPINVLNPVGFSIFTDRFTPFDSNSALVNIQGNLIGSIYGVDNVNSNYIASGVKGHFYYQNGILYGLDDDLPNSSMSQSDGLADISSYIQNESISLNYSIVHLNYPNHLPASTKMNLAYFLTYTSPCQPFEATLLTSDTTTCVNSPIQLGVTSTGSMTAEFEWLPQTNLSCYDCPNPIFTGDSTINYTVRIWASDSCSKVLPVRVRVLPEPNFESIEITESVCGGATGSIAVASSGLSQPHTFQINGGAPQNNGNFSNLAAGAYTVTVTNAVGCSKDSVVVVGEFNNVQAAFSVNPSSGDAPLDISINNQSQNASEYFWDFSDESGTTLHQGAGPLSGVEAPLAGLYTLTLIAGNGTPHCNDTTSVVILVKEPFEVFAYTFATDDAENYQIFLSGVSEYRYSLYSLDGKLVYQKSGAVENAGHVELWEIGNMASSMYLFRIWVKAESGVEEEVKGKLVVVR